MPRPDAMRYAICYDVPDDRRRLRIGKCLDSYGDRVQYSVFEAVLDRTLFEKLTRDLQALIDPQQDSVLIYALCGACAARRLALGLAASQTPPGEEEVFIA